MTANAVRRALRSEELEAVPRISDLEALVATTSGKVEIESLDEDRAGEVVDRILRAAVLEVFRELVPTDLHRPIIDAFEEIDGVSTGEDIGSSAYMCMAAEEVPALKPAVDAVLDGETFDGPAMVASAVELVLEGLHLSKRLNKHSAGHRARYAARA
jgi:magnesium chelatase subunit I